MRGRERPVVHVSELYGQAYWVGHAREHDDGFEFSRDSGNIRGEEEVIDGNCDGASFCERAAGSAAREDVGSGAAVAGAQGLQRATCWRLADRWSQEETGCTPVVLFELDEVGVGRGPRGRS